MLGTGTCWWSVAVVLQLQGLPALLAAASDALLLHSIACNAPRGILFALCYFPLAAVSDAPPLRLLLRLQRTTWCSALQPVHIARSWMAFSNRSDHIWTMDVDLMD